MGIVGNTVVGDTADPGTTQVSSYMTVDTVADMVVDGSAAAVVPAVATVPNVTHSYAIAHLAASKTGTCDPPALA